MDGMGLVVLGKSLLVQGPPEPKCQIPFEFGRGPFLLYRFQGQDRCAHGIALGEHLLVLDAMIESPIASHGKACDGTGTAVRLDPELLFHLRDELLVKEILPADGTI